LPVIGYRIATNYDDQVIKEAIGANPPVEHIKTPLSPVINQIVISILSLFL